MHSYIRKLLPEFLPLLKLAGPVVMAEVGWVTMGIVDTLMVSKLGPEAIGAVSVGSILFFTVAIFGMGLLLGLDTLISQSFGAGNLSECHRWLIHGVYLSLLITPLLTGVLAVLLHFLPFWGIQAAVLNQALPYLRALSWGLLPLLLYASFRRYLQAMNLTKPVMFALLSANGINVLANWVLIYGKLGAPALGAEGAGYSTSISRLYMALTLFAFIVYQAARKDTGLWRIRFRPESARLLRLMSLGTPAAMQITLEVGVFAAATSLAGRLAPAALAAHQIALNCASLTFMVPLGIASAGAVRVGQAVGRRDPSAARLSGWTALLLGAGFMACAGVFFLLFPRPIMKVFTDIPAVISTGVALLIVAAVFQLFDGLQVVATGVLRGAGDTRTPMLTNLGGHWLLGLPVGYFLGFTLKWGVLGLWIGLSLGLIAVGIVLLFVWAKMAKGFRSQQEA